MKVEIVYNTQTREWLLRRYEYRPHLDVRGWVMTFQRDFQTYGECIEAARDFDHLAKEAS